MQKEVNYISRIIYLNLLITNMAKQLIERSIYQPCCNVISFIQVNLPSHTSRNFECGIGGFWRMPNRLECFSGFGIKCIYSNDAYLFQWLIFKPPQPPTPPNFRPISDPFWLIWFINQRALCNHAFFVVVGVIGIICAPIPLAQA